MNRLTDLRLMLIALLIIKTINWVAGLYENEWKTIKVKTLLEIMVLMLPLILSKKDIRSIYLAAII